MLLAAARPGVTVVPAGEEAAALAPLPLRTLAVLAQEDTEARSQKPEAGRHAEARIRARVSAPNRAPSPESEPESRQSLAVLARWGLRTLGELAALPAADLSERLGQDGIRWQRLARGEDTGPLVPALEEEPFEASLELEWPIADLEPLSFVLTRLLDPFCQRLEHRDRGAAVLHLRLRLVTRDLHLRSLQLPAPMRDPKVLRTLLLLDLESHPAPAGIDAVTRRHRPHARPHRAGVAADARAAGAGADLDARRAPAGAHGRRQVRIAGDGRFAIAPARSRWRRSWWSRRRSKKQAEQRRVSSQIQ